MMSDSLQSSGGETNMMKSADVDFARATAEVRDLREENSKMRQDNLELNVSPTSIFFVFNLSHLLNVIVGTNYPIEINFGFAKVARLQLNVSPISQTHFESIFTTSAWSTTADADHMGDCGLGNGDLWFGPRQICPLNALTTTDTNHLNPKHYKRIAKRGH
jgi:hypothetical protein